MRNATAHLLYAQKSSFCLLRHTAWAVAKYDIKNIYRLNYFQIMFIDVYELYKLLYLL